MKKDEKAHGVQLLLRAIVRDPDGNVISDTGRKPSRSFVIQFLEFIYIMFKAIADYSTRTDITGAENYYYRDAWQCVNHLRLDAEINNSLYGLVVGTGDTAETNTDYKLETQLTEGAGVGEITHGAMVIGTAGVAGANVDLVMNRAFTNNLGAAIVVKEAGMYVRQTYSPGYSFCIVRDVFPGPVNVPDRCSLMIIYTMRTTV